MIMNSFVLRLLGLLLLFAPALCNAEELSPLESKYLSNPRQITSEYVKAGEGYFSPDGGTIVYQAIREGYPFYQIYSEPLAAAGKQRAKPKRISTGRGRTTCAYFHPSGKEILFASSHLDPDLPATEIAAIRQDEEDKKAGRKRRYSWDFDQQMELFVADTNGVIERKLTDRLGYDAECAFSPDGKRIVFCSDRDGDPDLYVMDLDAEGNRASVKQLTNIPGYDGGPFFAPAGMGLDGDWVIYRTDRKKEDYLQIHAIRVDEKRFGKDDVALTDNVGVNWAPYWHPTQPYIIWTGADHSDPGARPNYDLWMLKYQVDDNGLRGVGEPIRVTDHPSADVLPVFSPDGTQLLWTAKRGPDGGSQLWVADFSLPAAK